MSKSTWSKRDRRWAWISYRAGQAQVSRLDLPTEVINMSRSLQGVRGQDISRRHAPDTVEGRALDCPPERQKWQKRVSAHRQSYRR